MFSIGLQVLRAKLRGFHAAGSTISSRISKSEKERKNRLWDAKRQLGTHCRHHLVAYGLLRGVPYDQIERCAQNNKPNPQVVLDIMLAHADWQQKRGLDLEKVKQLLTRAQDAETASAQSVAASELSSPQTASQATQSQGQTPPSTFLRSARRLLEKRA